MARLYLNIAATAFIWAFMQLAAPAQAYQSSILGGLDEGARAYYEKDYRRAYNQWIFPAQRGAARAQYNIGVLYLNGFGVKKNEKAAFEWFHRAAKQGFARAQHNLGWMYQNGFFVALDIQQAKKWYQRAASKGFMNSESALGEILYMNKEYGEARAMLSRAARKGISRAQFLLAEIFAYGLGTSRDRKQALRWYRSAANKDNPDAQYKLARLYLANQEDSKAAPIGNDKQIAALLSQAAAHGHKDAINDFGWLLAANRTKSQNGAQDALYWFLQGARNDHVASAVNIAVLYSRGHGVSQSNQMTYMWLLIAEALSEEKIDKKIEASKEVFAKALTSDQREQAFTDAQAWFDGEQEK